MVQTLKIKISTIWKFLKKVKIELELPYDPEISLWTFIFKKTQKTLIPRNNVCISMFIAASFTVANMWKQPECPLTDE